MTSVSQAQQQTALSGPDEVDSRRFLRRPTLASSLVAGPLPAPADLRTAPRAAGRRPRTGDGRDGRDVVSIDRSGRYLVAAAIFTLVAFIGAVLIVATRHDVVGMALLLSGDALTIIIWVDYLRRP